MPEIEYEVYRERFRITERRDGCVYRTESLGTGWFDDNMVKANEPGKTDIMYVAASDEFAENNTTIRKKR